MVRGIRTLKTILTSPAYPSRAETWPFPSRVLVLSISSTYPYGKERVLARLGKEGGIRYTSGIDFACGLAGWSF
jgi:hypothetical protein